MHNHGDLFHVRGGDGRRPAAVKLVGAVDGVRVPVTPVQPVLEDADGKRVPQDLRRGEDDAANRTHFTFEARTNCFSYRSNGSFNALSPGRANFTIKERAALNP